MPVTGNGAPSTDPNSRAERCYRAGISKSDGWIKKTSLIHSFDDDSLLRK
jgi:hypothetical protein